jgi:hypothetical protein
MNSDTLMMLVAVVGLIILFSLWNNTRSQKDDVTDEEKKMGTYSEKQK